ncbi:MAG TPA: tetratricopeptide repeat protein [Flavobacterium sp.]|jgi:tetratricopeptide (TPR) repeat protein
MNKQQFTIAAALFISLAGHAQKEELKALKKIYDKDTPTAKDITDYRAALDQATPLMGAASASDRAYFDYYQASAPWVELSTGVNKTNPQIALSKITGSDVSRFSAASAAVIELEKNAGKKVLTEGVTKTIARIKPQLLSYAVQLGDKKKFREAADILYAVYQLDKSDADNLYYAANYAVDAKDTEAALRYYRELADINYSGEGTLYFATSLASDREESFASEAEMMKFVGLKTHTKPRKEAVPSKRGEIYKSIAVLLLSQNKTDEAKAAFTKARAENPNDTSLMLSEADLYLKLNEMDNYKRLIGEVLAKDPNNAVLTYNLGVVALNGGQPAEAEKHFLRAVELDPTSANAYINLAAIKLQADEKLVEQMNKLGTSAAENKRYDLLKAERTRLFQGTLPYLEKAHELQPENATVTDNLISVYNYLEMKDKYNALKATRK